jgi:hypothetical protein
MYTQKFFDSLSMESARQLEVNFNQLTKELQGSLKARFDIPNDEPFIYVNGNLQPFTVRNRTKYLCRVRKESLICKGFHIR